MPLSRCLSLVALFATGLTAFAADQPDRPPPHGQPAPAAGVPVPVAEFYTRMETKTAQAIKIQGMQINQKQEQTYYLRWTELAPDRGGNRRVRMRIDGVKLQLDIGGNVIEYDSTRPNPGGNEPLGKFFEALVGAEFTFTLDRRTGEVMRVEGRAEFVEKLAAANPAMQPVLDTILSDDAMKQMADPAVGFRVPAGAKKGDTWDRTLKSDLGPIGSYHTRNRFTLTDPNPKAPDLLRLSVDVDLRYEPPDPNKKTDKLPFTIKKGTLRSDPEWSTGFVLYDPKAGLPVRAETRVKLAGDLTIDLGGTEVEVGLAQDQATIIEFSTKPFLK